MTEPPTVSVVIPMHDAEQWILETLTSIDAQTHPVLECIVVNDGSTDDGPDLVRGFAATSGLAVRMIDGPCTGVAAALNRGIAAARGDLVALMDADDLWHPDKVLHQVRHLDDTGASVSISGFEMFPGGRDGVRWVVAHDDADRAVHHWLAMEGDGMLISSTALIRRDAFGVIGLFDLDFSVSADLEFMIRAVRLSTVAALPEALCEYRLHPGQMHRRTDDLISDMARLHRAMDGRDSKAAVRCHANRHAHHGYRLLLEGDWRRALAELLAALRLQPASIVRIPAAASGRRLLRRRQGRRQTSVVADG